MSATRAEIVETAREWIDTPFAPQGRTKGSACDCAGLVICVPRECGLVAPDFDVLGYSQKADGTSMVAQCRAYMDEIPPEDALPGDVVAIAFDARTQHLGILADYKYGGLSLIHASNSIDRPRVVEHRLMPHHRMSIRAAFRFRGIS